MGKVLLTARKITFASQMKMKEKGLVKRRFKTDGSQRGEGWGGWVKQEMGIQEGTCWDEHRGWKC